MIYPAEAILTSQKRYAVSPTSEGVFVKPKVRGELSIHALPTTASVWAMVNIMLYVLSLCIITTLPAWAGDESKTALRIMCYNIRHGRGMDDVVDLERTANVIREWKPDLVALQEMDKNTERTNKTDQTKLLAEMLKMHYVFGKAIDYQGGDYGLAILSRFPILEHQMILLPPEVQREQRGLLVVTIAVPNAGDADANNVDTKGRADANGRVIRFASTHLSVASPEERRVQIEKIDALMMEGSEPTIIAGDFNARPSNDAMVRFLENWKDTVDLDSDKKISPDRPERRIDYIFFRAKDSFEIIESRTIDDRITSDHMPIFSIISL
jgi:endonuclease/exonuclease/phosphatase family metal-dependent hydrolase